MSSAWKLRITPEIGLSRKVLSPCLLSDGVRDLFRQKEKIWVPQTTFPSTSEKGYKHMGFLFSQVNAQAQGW